MPIKMYIFGEASLWYRPLFSDQQDLEDRLLAFLENRGEVIHDRDEHSGLQWNVDLRLYADGEDIDIWIQRLTSFLRQWGVLDRNLFFTIIRESDTSTWEHRRVDLDKL
jgi:hypothetical protein